MGDRQRELPREPKFPVDTSDLKLIEVRSKDPRLQTVKPRRALPPHGTLFWIIAGVEAGTILFLTSYIIGAFIAKAVG